MAQFSDRIAGGLVPAALRPATCKGKVEGYGDILSIREEHRLKHTAADVFWEASNMGDKPTQGPATHMTSVITIQ